MDRKENAHMHKNDKPLSIPAASLCLLFGLMLGKIGASIYDAEEHYLVREFRSIEAERQERLRTPFAPENHKIAPSEIA